LHCPVGAGVVGRAGELLDKGDAAEVDAVDERGPERDVLIALGLVDDVELGPGIDAEDHAVAEHAGPDGGAVVGIGAGEDDEEVA
jgi:hypothetical protein